MKITESWLTMHLIVTFILWLLKIKTININKQSIPHGINTDTIHCIFIYTIKIQNIRFLHHIRNSSNLYKDLFNSSWQLTKLKETTRISISGLEQNLYLLFFLTDWHPIVTLETFKTCFAHVLHYNDLAAQQHSELVPCLTDVAFILSVYANVLTGLSLDWQCCLAVHRPVDKIKEDVWTRENHSGVFVNGMRVLDDVEGTKALLLLRCCGLTTHWQVYHHMIRFIRNLVHVCLYFLRYYGLFSVASQTIGVSFTVGAIQHGHGSCLGNTTGTGQWLAGKKYNWSHYCMQHHHISTFHLCSRTEQLEHRFFWRSLHEW